MDDSLPDDEELVSAYRAGHDSAASALFHRYYVRLVELIGQQMGWQLKELDSSADIAQSALQTLFARIRDQRVQLPSHNDLWPLLVTITLNKVRNRAKYWGRQRRDPSRQVPISGGFDPLEQGPSPEDIAILHEQVERLLEPFSGRRRRIVQRILEGCPVSEIAAEVGTTERTIYNTRQAAAKILKRILASE